MCLNTGTEDEEKPPEGRLLIPEIMFDQIRWVRFCVAGV